MVKMYIFVLFKLITQKAKLMKANTFLYTLNIYKIYIQESYKYHKHNRAPRFVYLYTIPVKDNKLKSN